MLAVRLVYLQIQVDRHCFAFCLSAWREKHTSRKKFCQDRAKRKRWRFLSVVCSKILPAPCGTFSPKYKNEIVIDRKI
ncbi:hypothetical protein CON82_17225 [Bacillus wiedmannii]|nr:hypothetical protein CON82_17225 [Bacillus wiedmannii]